MVMNHSTEVGSEGHSEGLVGDIVCWLVGFCTG